MILRMDSSTLKRSFVQAFGVLAYVTAVAWFMNNAQRFFGEQPGWFAGVLMLLLFVVSAAVTGSLVFGRSLLMYLDGAKLPAVRLALSTVGWLASFIVLGAAVLLLR